MDLRVIALDCATSQAQPLPPASVADLDSSASPPSFFLSPSKVAWRQKQVEIADQVGGGIGGVGKMFVVQQEELIQEICAVCLASDEFIDTVLLPCRHKFHGECILRWVEANFSCPLCRRVIEQFLPIDEDGEQVLQMIDFPPQQLSKSATAARIKAQEVFLKFIEIWERHYLQLKSDPHEQRKMKVKLVTPSKSPSPQPAMMSSVDDIEESGSPAGSDRFLRGVESQRRTFGGARRLRSSASFPSFQKLMDQFQTNEEEEEEEKKYPSEYLNVEYRRESSAFHTEFDPHSFSEFKYEDTEREEKIGFAPTAVPTASPKAVPTAQAGQVELNDCFGDEAGLPTIHIASQPPPPITKLNEGQENVDQQAVKSKSVFHEYPATPPPHSPDCCPVALDSDGMRDDSYWRSEEQEETSRKSCLSPLVESNGEFSLSSFLMGSEFIFPNNVVVVDDDGAVDNSANEFCPPFLGRFVSGDLKVKNQSEGKLRSMSSYFLELQRMFQMRSKSKSQNQSPPSAVAMRGEAVSSDVSANSARDVPSSSRRVQESSLPPKLQAANHLKAGAAAGVATSLLVYAFDGNPKRFATSVSYHRGLMGGLALFRGVPGFFSGFAPTLFSVIPTCMVYFSVYEHMKNNTFYVHDSKNHSFFQTGAYVVSAAIAASLGHMMHKPSVLIPVRYGIQFGIFELGKSMWQCAGRNDAPERHLGPLAIMSTAALGGLAASTVIYPVQNVLARMATASAATAIQVNPILAGSSGLALQTTTFSRMNSVLSSSHLNTVYKGWGPALARFLPSCVLTATAYEFALRSITE